MTTTCTREDVLLKVSELTKGFGGRSVLKSVNVDLRRGQVVLLRGENGSGKTTLLNILTGNLEADYGNVEYLSNAIPQRFCFPRKWWHKKAQGPSFTPEFAVRERVARTWQDIRLFKSHTLSENVAVARLNQRGENPFVALLSRIWLPDEAETTGRARRLLRRVGLIGKYEHSADRVSLGEAKRTAIARALATGADALFLDEPLSGLDHRGAKSIVDLLTSLVTDHGTTLVIVEHVLNQPLLLPLANTDWLLEDGKITVTDLRTTMPAPSKSSNLHWRPLLKEYCSDWTETSLQRGAILTRIRKPGAVANEPSKVLEICDLVASHGDRLALGLDGEGRAAGLNLELYDGEIAVLEAPNGWGKTTLSKVLAGLHSSHQGTLILDGRRVDTLPAWQRANMGLSVLLSNSDLFPRLRVEDVLRLAGDLEVDGWGSLLKQKCSSLSGGERQRVALYACRHSRVTVQDEPFLSLDGPGIAMAVSRYINTTGAHLLLIPRAL